ESTAVLFGFHLVQEPSGVEGIADLGAVRIGERKRVSLAVIGIRGGIRRAVYGLRLACDIAFRVVGIGRVRSGSHGDRAEPTDTLRAAVVGIADLSTRSAGVVLCA